MTIKTCSYILLFDVHFTLSLEFIFSLDRLCPIVVFQKRSVNDVLFCSIPWMSFWLSIKFWEGTYFSSCMCVCVHIFVCICVLALRMNCQSRHFCLSSDAGNFFMIIFLLLTFIHSPYFLLWTFSWISLGTFRYVLRNS